MRHHPKSMVPHPLTFWCRTSYGGDMNITGPEFRTTRVAAGVTVRALAAHVGITHPTLSRWERGERDLGPNRIPQLVAALQELQEEQELETRQPA